MDLGLHFDKQNRVKEEEISEKRGFGHKIIHFTSQVCISPREAHSPRSVDR